MVVGPFESIDLGGGRSADLYLIRFDAKGRCRSPRTQAQFLDAVGQATDVFVFSHGWNNVFDVALRRYRSFITGYMRQRRTFHLPEPAGYRPLLLGVIWPSTSFVLPWESGPDIAAALDADGPPEREREEMLALVTDGLDDDAAAELSELLDGRTAVDVDDARRAAELVLDGLRSDADPETGSPPPTPDELLKTWALLDARSGSGPGPDVGGDLDTDEGDFGTVDGPAPAAPQAAGLNLDPRNLLRAGTLWTMKARAGTVGFHGVGPVVQHVLGPLQQARLHLVGHSFGARVVLSALASGTPRRKAHSMLLLQPAVNRWCFAENVANTGRRGGYAGVPGRLEQPIVTTFSSHDAPLHDYFHLAVRGSSLGEPDIAGVGDPDLYGALGGYGPSGLGGAAVTEKAAVAGSGTYPLGPGHKLVAVDGATAIDGEPAIGGHGDISNPTTWWALHQLTKP